MNAINHKISDVLIFVVIIFLFSLPISSADVTTEESMRLTGFKVMYPNTSIDYRGVVAIDANGDFDDELVCDFGTNGIWIYNGGAWVKINPSNPDWIFSFHYGGTEYLLADLGASGLWYWYYNGYWTGVWVKISGYDAEFGFTVNDAGGDDEIHIDFGSQGLWRYDMGGAPVFLKLNGSSPPALDGFRSDFLGSGTEEGVFDYGADGLWMVYDSWGVPNWTRLNSLGPGDDNTSADVGVGDTAEELIIDFGLSGLWLYNGTAWNKLNSYDPYDLKEVKFPSDSNCELLCYFGSVSGLWLWDYTGSYPGSWSKISNNLPDWDGGFCEPYDPDDDGWEEVAVDFGSNGLWQYEYSTNSWKKLNGSNPEFMVRADLLNEGNKTTLVVDFGSSIGLWYYNGKTGTWTKLSAFSPDGVI